MPLYYFHLRDGSDQLLDPEGSILVDIDAARTRAIAAARSLMSADVLDGRLRLNQHIDIEDEHGAVVHCLPFPGALEIVPPEAWVGPPAPGPR